MIFNSSCVLQSNNFSLKRKALDLLKDKRKEEHIKAENVAEARMLDDLSIQRIRSKNSEEEK